MSRSQEAGPQVVETEHHTFEYGQDGWNMDTLSLFDVLVQDPALTDVLTEARVAYAEAAGNDFATSPDGWRVHYYMSPEEKPDTTWYGPRLEPIDERIEELGLEDIFEELGTSTTMTLLPWVQPVINLERVTGRTHQDFMFVAGISELQALSGEDGRAFDAERVAAFTDIKSRNPVGEFGAPFRLTRNIQLADGVESPTGDFNSTWFGPNIRLGEEFGLPDMADQWVAWSMGWDQSGTPSSALYPVEAIVSVTEHLPGGQDGLVIPTTLGRQAMNSI